MAPVQFPRDCSKNCFIFVSANWPSDDWGSRGWKTWSALVEIELRGPASGLDGLGLAAEVVQKIGLRAALDKGGRKPLLASPYPGDTERGCGSLGSAAAEDVRPSRRGHWARQPSTVWTWRRVL